MSIFIKMLFLLIVALSLTMCATGPKQPEEIDVGFCISCHQERTPGLFQSWVESKHAANGVTCVTCHTDHQAAYEPKATVSTEKCEKCHSKQVEEFRKSRHSLGWERMRTHGEYLGIPQQIRSAFCEACHVVEKKCNSCHASHAFSSKTAREPEACGNCHLGPDHPHKEMYETSLHGMIYKMTQNPERAPRCVTCHMPGGTHDSSFGIARGPVGTKSGVVDLKGDPISREEEEKRREEMIQVCTECHSRRFAGEQLENADQVKEEAFKLQDKGKEVIQELEKEGLLFPSVAERFPHPTEGQKLILSDPQLYIGTSDIEGRFFRMFKFHSIKVWKSGYHFSPAYVHRYGWSEMQLDLTDIQDESNKLRELFKNRKK